MVYDNGRDGSYQIEELSLKQNQSRISLIKYAHDPVPEAPLYLALKMVTFPRYPSYQVPSFKQNAFRLDPQRARLPYRCSLDATYENIFWKSSLTESISLLELMAADQSASDMEVDDGVTMAKLALGELRPGLEYRFNKATSYMFCFCDEQRIKLLAASMVLLFLFGDKTEKTPDANMNCLIDDYVSALQNVEVQNLEGTKLQGRINSVMQGFRNANSQGGRDVVEAMILSFRHTRPKKAFNTLREYLDFRHMNVSADYVLAAVKFSISSEVDIEDARCARFLTLIKDHLSIINDLASFDKELRAYSSGASRDLLNIVYEFQRMLSLPDVNAAKALAYSYQLQTEEWIREELERLKGEDLSLAQWQYLEAVFACAAGNAFYSMTSSRYGGEAARIDS